jgi:hypothetical protein
LAPQSAVDDDIFRYCVVAVAEEVVVAVDNASSVGTIEGAAAESMTVLAGR